VHIVHSFATFPQGWQYNLSWFIQDFATLQTLHLLYLNHSKTFLVRPSIPFSASNNGLGPLIRRTMTVSNSLLYTKVINLGPEVVPLLLVVQLAAANPVTSSQPETQTPSSRPMSSVDIGLMVGAIVLFFVIITSIFVVRVLDERRRAKRLLQTVEDGNAEGQYEHRANEETNVTELRQIGSTSMRHTRVWERESSHRSNDSMIANKHGNRWLAGPQRPHRATQGRAHG